MTKFMRLGRAFRSMTAWTVIATTFAQLPITSFAADEGRPADIAGLGQEPIPVPQPFNAALGAGVAQTFASCQTASIQQLIMGIGETVATAATGGLMMQNFNMSMPCPTGSDFDPNDLECSVLSPGGKFDPTSLKNYEMEIAKGIFAAQCKKAKLMAAQAQLKCLESQALALTSAIRSVQAGYDTYIDDRRNVITQVKKLVEERKAQEEDVNERLNGSESGRPGLRQVKQELEALTAGMHQQVNEIKAQTRDLTARRAIHEEQVANRTMHLASSCFAGPSDLVQNARGGEPACLLSPDRQADTLADHIVCVYQNNLAQKNGVKGDSFDINQAGVCASKLRSVLGVMFAPPTEGGGKISTGLDASDSGFEGNSELVTVADLENDFGDDLAAFDARGTTCAAFGLNKPIHDFVMDYAGACLARAAAGVKTERGQKSSKIGAAEHNIKTAEDGVRAFVNTQLDTFVKSYSKGTDALTGTPAIFPQAELNKCRGETPEGQVTCLTNAADSLQKIVEGGEGFGTDITIAALHDGSRPANARATIAFSCNGLEKCIAKYEHAHKFLKDEGKRLTTGLTEFVQQSNQHIEQFTNTMATRMSGASDALHGSLKDVNQLLASIGVGGVDIGPVQAETLQQGEDGLYDKPQNLLGLVGGKMNPPMLDIAGNNFSGALAGVAGGMENVDEEMRKQQGKMLALQGVGQKCVSEEIASLAEGYDKLYDLNCGSAAQFCSAQGRNAIDNLTSTLEGLGQGGFEGTESTLTTGSNICNQSYASAVNPVELQECQRKEEAVEKNGGTVGTKCQRILSKDYDNQVAVGQANMNAGRCMAIVQRLQNRAEEINARRRLAGGNATGAF